MACFFEVHESYAGNIVCGYARLNGTSVGIVANQPMVLGGCGWIFMPATKLPALFAHATLSISPLSPLWMFLVIFQEPTRSITASYRLGRNCSMPTVKPLIPKLTVTTRKSYGGAYCVMSSKHLRGDLNLAWPTAEIAVMGPEGRSRDYLST